MGIIDILGNLSGKLNQHQRQRIEDAEHLLEKIQKENEDLRAENDELRGRLRTYEEQEKQRSGDMDEGDVTVLRLVVTSPGVLTKEVTRMLHIDEPRAQYHLDRLVDRDFISVDSYLEGTAVHYPEAAGRAYLFDNNLMESAGGA